jgi:hypothetical protein
MNQILKRQTSRFHYDSKAPAVTKTTPEQNSCQSSTKSSEANVTLLRHTLIKNYF